MLWEKHLLHHLHLQVSDHFYSSCWFFFPVGGTVVQANSGWGYFELQKRRTAVVLSVLVGGSLTSFLPPLLPSTLGFLNHRHTSHKSTQHIHHPHFISSHIRGVSSLLWQGLIGFSNQIDLESVSTSFLQKHIKMFLFFFFFLERSAFLNPTSVFFFLFFFTNSFCSVSDSGSCQDRLDLFISMTHF